MLLFPFESIPKDSNIILYGAGNCGIEFFRQIVNSGYCNLVLWVDQRYEFFESSLDKYGCIFPVSKVEEIRNIKDFDFIVIAIVNAKISENVCHMLASDYGVPLNKIVKTVHEYAHDTVYGNYKNEYQLKPKEAEEVISVVPSEIIRANELSIMPRYLLARDIKNNICNEAHLSLYKRTILAQGDLFTGNNYFSQRNKSKVEDFLREFRQLTERIETSDFEKENYVPIVYGNRIVLDGQHRIAASLALEKNIWIKYYPDSSEYGDGFGFSWFKKNGFGTEDMQRILYAYGCNYPRCGIFVLFGTVRGQWDYFLSQIEKNCTIVGYVDLDFSTDYVAFENVIRALYKDPLWKNVQIHLKSMLLKLAPLMLRVVLVSDEKDHSRDIYEVVREKKLLLRESVSNSIEIDAGAVMHASDSFAEFVLLRDLLLSPNNIRNFSWMYERKWRPEFIEKLDRLRKFLYENGIRVEDVVVVGGSVLEIFGLRYSDDIDITIKSNYRKKVGYGFKRVDEDIEICQQDHVIGENGILYKDDVLIEDDDLHFLFYGIKFINLEILKTKKCYDKRQKDIEDVRLIEIFQEYTANIDDKKVLRAQLDRELHLKRY